jgi:hypothetical protein
MTLYRSARAMNAESIEACPGDVFCWYSTLAKKHKYHLFLTWDFDYVLLNTPKDRQYPADFKIHSSQIQFLTPTSCQFSTVSCGTLLTLSNGQGLRTLNTEFVGNVSSSTLLQILRHIANGGMAKPAVTNRISGVIADFTLNAGGQRLTSTRC